MGNFVTELIRDSLLRFTRGVRTDQAHECQYGNTAGSQFNCTKVVPPNEGYRQSGMVFCSDEHAALDQEDQAF